LGGDPYYYFSPLGKSCRKSYMFTLRNFYIFLSSTSFLMISRRQVISGPIFAIFTSNESVLDVDDRSGPLFSISQGTLPWQPILCKKMANSPHFVALAFRNGMGYRYVNGRVNSVNDACILCENFVKFGPVTPELTGLICERLL